MIYLYNKKVNPKRYVLYALCAACVAVGVSFFFFAGTLIGLASTCAGILVAGAILKELVKVQSARISTYTEGFTAYTSDGSTFAFEWKDVTHAGIVASGEYKGTVFVYAEASDKFIQLQRVFLDFDSFIAELQQNTPWKEYTLAEGETVTVHLRKLLGVEKKEEKSDTI